MATETTPCTCHGDDSLPCDRCDPPGRATSIRGDADGDFDADDAAELEAWVATYTGHYEV